MNYREKLVNREEQEDGPATKDQNYQNFFFGGAIASPLIQVRLERGQEQLSHDRNLFVTSRRGSPASMQAIPASPVKKV